MSIIYLAVGIFLGWFFLPTPEFAKTALAALIAKVPFLARFVKKD
jgi:hypothetical protein